MQIPEFLYNNLVNDYGEEIALKIIDRFKLKRVVSLRVNTLKSNKEELENENIK